LRRFGGDTAVLAHPMITNGEFRAQIVGVLAPRFRLYFLPEANVEPEPEVWFANRLNYDTTHRNSVSIHAVGRLTEAKYLERTLARGGVDQKFSSSQTFAFHPCSP
jgi:hypothetical protein